MLLTLGWRGEAELFGHFVAAAFHYVGFADRLALADRVGQLLERSKGWSAQKAVTSSLAMP